MGNTLYDSIRFGYLQDKNFGQIYASVHLEVPPRHVKHFNVKDGILYYQDPSNNHWRTCIPDHEWTSCMTSTLQCLQDTLDTTRHTAPSLGYTTGHIWVRISRATFNPALLVKGTRTPLQDHKVSYNHWTYHLDNGTQSQWKMLDRFRNPTTSIKSPLWLTSCLTDPLHC